MTQKTERVGRDVAILIAAVGASALIGLFVARQLFSEQWHFPGFVVGIFVGQILLKSIMPRHSMMRLMSGPMC